MPRAGRASGPGGSWNVAACLQGGNHTANGFSIRHDYEFILQCSAEAVVLNCQLDDLKDAISNKVLIRKIVVREAAKKRTKSLGRCIHAQRNIRTKNIPYWAISCFNSHAR